LISVFSLHCVLAQGNPAVGGPVLGYVFDHGSGDFQPVLGIPGASQMGQPFSPGAAVSSAAVARGYALVITGQDHAAALVRFGNGAPVVSPISGVAGAFDQVYLSPSGSAAILYRAAGGFAQVVTGLPDSPLARNGITVANLGGNVSILAVSDDGGAVLAAVHNDQADYLFSIAADGTPTQLPFAGPVSAMVFQANSHDIALADTRDNSISVIRHVDGSADYQVAAGPNDGVAGPVAVEFSDDGSKLFTANSGSGNILVIDLGGGPAAAIPCQCSVSGLHRLSGSIFRLNDLSNGPLMLFDGASTTPQVVFVPSDSQRSGQ